MKWGCVALVAAGLCSSALGVHAQDATTRGYDPCRGVTSSDEVQACEARELIEQNKALNSEYSKYFAILSTDQKKALRAAERAWIAFRHADCESATAQITIVHGAGLGILMRWMDDERADCLLKATHERVIVLEQRYKEEKEWLGASAPRPR
jgi:uncharacterized protein YecT (DUF1311 family)